MSFVTFVGHAAMAESAKGTGSLVKGKHSLSVLELLPFVALCVWPRRRNLQWSD